MYEISQNQRKLVDCKIFVFKVYNYVITVLTVSLPCYDGKRSLKACMHVKVHKLFSSDMCTLTFGR